MEHRSLPLELPPTPYDAHPLTLPEAQQAEGRASSGDALTAEHDATENVSVQAQCVELSRLAHRTQRRTDLIMWAIPLFYCLMTVLLLLCKFWLGEERSNAILGSPLTYIPLALFWIGVTVTLLRSAGKPRKQMREMARALGESGSIRAAGALLDTFQQEDQKVHQAAKEGLTEILPRFQPADADLLTPAQRAALVRQLNLPLLHIGVKRGASASAAYRRNVEFRIAILKALAQIGDESALPIVQRLACSEAKSDVQRRIQAAAATALPDLLLRVEQQHSHQTLLRASDASANEPESLLRAASGSSAKARPEQLLKPASPDS